MNQIPIYQHPFVDVFRATKLTEWQTSQKEGEVTEVYDKQLTKNVIKISGATPASNYMQVPAQKHLPKKALGLIGKYVYSIVNVPAGKTFVIHFDYIVNETRLVRLSLSNIFKEFKNLNGNSIQIPAGDYLQYNRWTMLALNAQQILEDNQVFAPGQKQSFYMRSLQITANLQLRGIFTSDIKYTVATLPKEMAFKILKGQDWFGLYGWIDYPAASGEGRADKENEATNTVNSLSSVRAPKSQVKSKSKSVKFTSEDRKIESLEEEKIQTKIERNTLESQPHQEINETLERQELIEKTVRDIEDIKNQYCMSLEEKNLQSNAEVTLFYNQDSSLYPKPLKRVARTLNQDQAFVLKPKPIMKLDRTIGFHPRFTSGQVYFNRDLKLSREILYTQANLIIGYQHSSQKQRIFYEKTGNIEYFHIDGNYALSATKGDLHQDSKDFEVCIWDVQEAKSEFAFKPPLSSIHSMSLNEVAGTDTVQYLCISGKDFQKRDLILVYNFQEMIRQKKVEIYARQLCDFDLFNIRFSDAIASSLVACGRENIRFFKIKNGHLPGQSVTLNNTGRGKVFTRSLVNHTVNEKGLKKPTNVYVTTLCGLLYIVNFSSRQVEKIIQIHEDRVTSLLINPAGTFIATASINGLLRLWSPDFSKLISEVNTQQQILSCDLNHKEIAVLGAGGTISILDMEESTFNVVVRSHLDNVQDLCFNKASGNRLVSIGLDSKIYIWNAESMEVLTEFSTQNDLGTKLASSLHDPTVAVGFKSGFIRIFDLSSSEQQGKLLAETMIFDSPVVELQYSPDNKFLAVFYKCSRIVIFCVAKGYQPVKNIEYEFPNENYFSLSFSPDDRFLANISSNANNVTVWETKNFSLKYHLDLTGDIISKVQFAPNGKDLVLLTTSSKIKFYRITSSFANELQFNKEIYGVTDLECLDFAISPNCKYLAVCGKEGVIKVFDYFMRGAAVPSCQAFLGHFKHPRRIYWTDDMRNIFSLGDGNGIFKWSFFGDKDFPSDLSQHFEELAPTEALLKVEDGNPTFNHEDLQRMANLQMDDGLNKLANEFGQVAVLDPANLYPNPSFPEVQNQNFLARTGAQQFQQTVQYNTQGYRFEQYDLELKKVLQCSITEVRDNLVWNRQARYIAYSAANFVIVEDLNQEKTQRLLKEGNDKIYSIKLSPNGKYLLAYTQQGKLDGFPNIFIWEASTLKKVNHIAINDSELISVEFSGSSNMLLVISKTEYPGESGQGHKTISQVAVWDFLDGHRDILCKSHLPLNILSGMWNIHLGPEANEFVTISERQYHFWKIAGNLTLHLQEGDIPKEKSISSKDTFFTTCEFVVPTPEQLSVYMLLGLSNGYVWIIDSRCNQFISSVKVLDGAIRKFYSAPTKILVEGKGDQILHCWSQLNQDRSNPHTFFAQTETKLTLDGAPIGVCYEGTYNEGVVSTSSGTLWFVSWAENATIKIKSCHSPAHAIAEGVDFKYLPPGQFVIDPSSNQDLHQFDQNYLVATSGKDGVIKLWNLFDSEFILQFIVPKEECVALALHQFKPYMVASFTDGFLRFFEIQSKSKTLGRCLITPQAKGIESGDSSDFVDYLTQIKILPSGNHILGASKYGQIVLIYVQQWDPLAVKIECLASMNTTIHSFDVSYLEPYNKWLVGTANGKVLVYNRKDFNAYQQEIFEEANPPRFNYMDSFNVLDYVDNSFTESKRCNTLDHYYSMAKRNIVRNEVDKDNLCQGMFSNSDLTLHISFIAKVPYLFVRNFELHQVVRRIPLTSLPLSMSLTPNSPFFIVVQADGVLKMIDSVNIENTSEIRTTHEEVKVMKICPNGRYVLTGGSQGDVTIWQIKRRSLIETPETLEMIMGAGFQQH